MKICPKNKDGVLFLKKYPHIVSPGAGLHKNARFFTLFLGMDGN
jgi:hypothetical protein